MTDKTLNVLFLCTGNSARSILAEVLLNHLGKDRFRAYSAGSRPAGRVNPMTLEILEECGYPTENLRSKSWDEFAQPHAPVFDIVITVCDNASREPCPVWPGAPQKLHWGMEDPASPELSEPDQRRIFKRVHMELERRIRLLVELPLDKLKSSAF